MKNLNRKTKIISLIIASLLVMMALAFTSKTKQEEKPVYREYNVSTDDIIVGIDGDGTITSKKNEQFIGDNIKFEEYVVRVGDKIKKGDVIARINKEDIKKNKEKLELALNDANTALQSILLEKQQFESNIYSEVENTKMKSKELYDGEIAIKNNSKKDVESNMKINNEKINAARVLSQQYENESLNRSQEILNIDNTVTALKNKNIQYEQEITSLDPVNDADKIGELQNSIALNKIEIEQLEISKENLKNKDYDTLIRNEQEKISQAEQENSLLKSKVATIDEEIKKINENREGIVNNENKAIEDKRKQNELKLKYYDNKINKAKILQGSASKEMEDYKKTFKSNEIKSDYDGIVTAIDYKQNELSSVLKPIIVISEDTSMSLQLKVSALDIKDVEPDQKVTFYVDAYPDVTFHGKVKNSSNLVDDKGLLNVEVSIDEGQEELFIGAGANATIIIKEKLQITVVNNKVIYTKEGKQFVKKLDENQKVNEVEIKTGFSDGRVSEILSGLQPGDVVVVEE